MLKCLCLFVLSFVTLPAISLGFPQRIASGTVGSDEVLLELLKGEEHRLVAVSLFADNPKYSFIKQLPPHIKAKVGDNIENLLLLKPDLVFLASYTAANISAQLKAAKVNVHVQKSFGSYADVKNNIKEMGKLIGKDKAAEALIAEMDKTVEESRKKQKACSQKPSFLQYVANDFLPGKGTIIDDVGEIAGYHNILRDVSWEGWKAMSQEVLIQQNPDIILASSGEAKDAKRLVEILKSRPAWQKMSAVREERVLIVPDRLLYTVGQHTANLVAFLMENRPCPAVKK